MSSDTESTHTALKRKSPDDSDDEEKETPFVQHSKSSRCSSPDSVSTPTTDRRRSIEVAFDEELLPKSYALLAHELTDARAHFREAHVSVLEYELHGFFTTADDPTSTITRWHRMLTESIQSRPDVKDHLRLLDGFRDIIAVGISKPAVDRLQRIISRSHGALRDLAPADAPMLVLPNGVTLTPQRGPVAYLREIVTDMSPLGGGLYVPNMVLRFYSHLFATILSRFYIRKRL